MLLSVPSTRSFKDAVLSERPCIQHEYFIPPDTTLRIEKISIMKIFNISVKVGWRNINGEVKTAWHIIYFSEVRIIV